MAKYKLTSSEWTEIPFDEGAVQNKSSLNNVEISDTQEEGTGVIIGPNEEFNWSNSTIYAKTTSGEAYIRVVPFSSAGGMNKAEALLLNDTASRLAKAEEELATAKQDLSNTKEQLATTDDKLTKAQKALADAQKEIEDIKSNTDIDASRLTSGTIDIARIPKAALERVVSVADDAARLALTINDIQDGDTVQVLSNNNMYFVIDDTKLGTENAFTQYKMEVQVTTDTAKDCTGNSATATKLKTPVTIYGNSFDGTQNINISADDGTGAEPNQIVKINKNGQLATSDLLKIVKCGNNASDIASSAGEEVGTADVVSTWTRISCVATDGSNQNSQDDDQVKARNAYTYYESQDVIVCNQNSDPFSAFLSKEAYEPDYTVNYLLDNRLLYTLDKPSFDDDDGLVFVCGYMVDNAGKFHTLSVWRMGDSEANSGTGHGSRFAICYDNYTAWPNNRKSGTGLTLATNSTLKTTSWGSTTYCYCQVTKTSTQIIAKTSEVNSSTLSCTLTFTLPTSKPSDWTQEQYNNIKYMMENNSKIGFGTESNCSAFKILSMSGSIGRTTVYDFENYKTLKYENGTQVSSTDLDSSIICPNTFYYSSLTGKLFYCKSLTEILPIT